MYFLAIDGNSLMNRAFYGIKSLSNSKGQATNAIYGFLNILLKLTQEISPKYMTVAFDVKKPTFRSKLYNNYKGTRNPTPKDLISQLDITKKILPLMGISFVECPGFEADDILGTLSTLADSKNNLKFLIATGDKDCLQLIDDNVIVKIMSTKLGSSITTDYDKQKILDLYKIHPNQLIDVKALMGDNSDNIPGVAGIGEKTALSLIYKYHDIENIFNNINFLDEKISLKNKLISSKKIIMLSKNLATIYKLTPIDLNIENYIKSEINKDLLFEFLSELEMFSIIKRLNLKPSSDQITSNIKLQNYYIDNTNIVSIDKIEKFLLDIFSKKNYHYKIFILFLSENNLILYINNKIFLSKTKEINLKVFSILLFHKDQLDVYTHYAKKLHHFLFLNYNDSLNIKFDSLIAAYLLSPGLSDYSLEKLFINYLNIDQWLTNVEKIFSFISLSKIMEEKILENNLSYLFNEIELPLTSILTKIELNGITINQKGLILFGEELAEKIEKLQNEIFSFVGYNFNINSPKQLSNLLFKDLKLPTRKKNKSGYSTSAEVLESLKDKHPIIDKILNYRLLIKLKTTYVDGLLKEISSDNKIHSIFNQTETKTGRISSEKPNIQNIPIKTSLGCKLRELFIADKNHYLIDGDYSQIELRILADFSGDKNMIFAFNNNLDIHILTASELFNTSPNNVTSTMRSFAKSVNFSIIYGISSFSLAHDIKVSLKEAQQYIDSYFEKFHDIKSYLDTTIANAKKNGYVTTIAGRRRYINELNSPNKIIRSFGERIAKNTPIQGSAADIIKIAMINVNNKLKTNNLKSKLILQVHDELIIESPESEINIAKRILQEEMQKAWKLKVPLKVEIGVGNNWHECH